MQKLFKTFWKDNGIALSIICLIVFVITIIIPSSFLGILSLNTTYSQEALSFSFSIAITLVGTFIGSISFPALAIFISIRTTKGKARLRYNSITTSRIAFSLFGVIIYILLSIILQLLVGVGLLIVSLLFNLPLVDFFDAIYDLLYNIFLGSNPLPQIIAYTIMLLGNGLFTFYYWNLLFLLPHTKSMRKLPFALMLLAIGGVYIVFQILSSFANFAFLFNNVDVNLKLFMNILALLIFAGTYHTLFIKAYES